MSLNSTIADTQPYILNVISTQRENFPTSNSTRFRLRLQYPILYCSSVKLLTATIPNTMYVFNGLTEQAIYGASLRLNTWIDFIDSSATEKNAEIPAGTYTFSELKPILENVMNLASGVDTYTVTLDPNTLKVTISSSNPNFQILWSTGIHGESAAPANRASMYYELGFNKTDTAVAQDQVALRSINLAGPYNLFIQCAQLKNVIHDSKNFTSSFQIPLDVEYGNIKYWKANSEYDSQMNISLKNITYLDIELISDYGPVNLNNADWGFMLRFE